MTPERLEVYRIAQPCSNEFIQVIKELREAVHEPLLLFGGRASYMKSPRWCRVVQSVHRQLYQEESH